MGFTNALKAALKLSIQLKYHQFTAIEPLEIINGFQDKYTNISSKITAILEVKTTRITAEQRQAGYFNVF